MEEPGNLLDLYDLSEYVYREEVSVDYYDNERNTKIERLDIKLYPEQKNKIFKGWLYCNSVKIFIDKVYDEMKKQKDIAAQEYLKFEKEIATLQTKLKESQSQNNKLKNEISSLKEKVEELSNNTNNTSPEGMSFKRDLEFNNNILVDMITKKITSKMIHDLGNKLDCLGEAISSSTGKLEKSLDSLKSSCGTNTGNQAGIDRDSLLKLINNFSKLLKDLVIPSQYDVVAHELSNDPINYLIELPSKFYSFLDIHQLQNHLLSKGNYRKCIICGSVDNSEHLVNLKGHHYHCPNHNLSPFEKAFLIHKICKI